MKACNWRCTNHNAYLAPVPLEVQRADVHAIQQHSALVRVIEPLQQLHHCRFSTATATHQGDLMTRGDCDGQVAAAWHRVGVGQRRSKLRWLCPPCQYGRVGVHAGTQVFVNARRAMREDLSCHLCASTRKHICNGHRCTMVCHACLRATLQHMRYPGQPFECTLQARGMARL